MNGRRLALALSCSLLAACARTPPAVDRTAPVPPAAWESLSLPAGEATQRWWQSFADPALDRLIAAALTANLDVQRAAAAIDEARALRAAATAERWPLLEFSASASRQRGRGRNVGDAITISDLALGLDASWEVDLFGRLASAADAAGARLAASLADRDAVRLSIASEVAIAYVEYRLYQAQAALAAKSAAAQGGVVRITRARYEQGVAGRFDLERARALQATSAAAEEAASALAGTARQQLILLTAATPAAVDDMLGGAQALPSSSPLRVLPTPTEVFARRPDVQAAAARLAAAASDRAAAEALRFPRLTLAGMLGLDQGQLNELFNPGARAWSIGAGLLTPLIDFGRIRAGIDAADARALDAYLAYEQRLRQALQETESALVGYAHGVRRERQLAAAVEAGRTAATLARRQYHEGSLSLLEVLDSERSLYDAERERDTAAAEVALRVVGLYKALGIVPPST